MTDGRVRRSRARRDARCECPQYATKITMVAAIGSVVDARTAKPPSLTRRRLFRKIHLRRGDFGKFFGFFSKFFWGRRRSPFCGARHGVTRHQWSRRDVGDDMRSADDGRVTVVPRVPSPHLVKPNTSKGLRIVHRPIDGPLGELKSARCNPSGR